MQNYIIDSIIIIQSPSVSVASQIVTCDTILSMEDLMIGDVSLVNVTFNAVSKFLLGCVYMSPATGDKVFLSRSLIVYSKGFYPTTKPYLATPIVIIRDIHV